MTGARGAGARQQRHPRLGPDIMGDAGYALRDGRLVRQRPGSELLRLHAGGRQRPAVTVPATEQFLLPRLAPRCGRCGSGWAGSGR